MTDTFDVGRELAAGIGGPEDAWRFIRSFAASWRTPLLEDDGVAEAELDAAETRLGLRLPAALREAYRLFGRRTDLTSNQDVLLGPERLTLDEDGQALVFRTENQAVAHWGVPVAELERADPPVAIRVGLADRSAERWEPWLDRFSAACVEIVLSESLFVSEELGDNRALEEGEAGLLEDRYTRLALPEYPATQTPGVRWFAGPDVIIRDDQRTWMWARARTTEAIDAVRTGLPGDWMMAEVS
jgi:hypothetical protein